MGNVFRNWQRIGVVRKRMALMINVLDGQRIGMTGDLIAC
jgi:hypothetical protein